MVHNAAFGDDDGNRMNQKKVYIMQARDGHHFLRIHPYLRVSPILGMLAPKAHKPRLEDAPDGSQCCIR